MKPIRKNFFKGYKLHKVAADDDLRPNFGYVHFRNGYAYATDAHVCVRAKIADICNFEPQEQAMLEGFSLHALHYAELLKYNVAEVVVTTNKDGVEAFEIVAHKQNRHEADYTIHFPLVEMHAPDFEKVLSKPRQECPSVEKIGLSVELLRRICEACDFSPRVGLRFNGASDAMRVTDQTPGADVTAILMPVMID